ncbi:MAG: TonB-dependent receptor [Sphingomonas sp.]
MSRSLQLASLFLFSSALVAPSLAYAQSDQSSPTGGAAGGQATGNTTPSTTPPSDQAATPGPATPGDQTTPPSEPVDVSVPGGGDIVVTGRRNTNISRSAPQVVSVLSSADIARTGAGDIAGALARVPGLSVVGNGFVYVRGLGDRYSLALLNGSPLPSPEPLKRVVPLDIFPTNIISSSLIQKSYSVNFPGEFGGGVINLTTKAAPKESFLTIGVGGGIDTETTGRLGYTYYGSKTDFTGFGNGNRKLSPTLSSFLASGQRISQLTTADNSAIAATLVNGRNSVVQRNGDIPPNASATASAGTSFDALGATFGVLATAGYSNKWRTRDTIQQTGASADLSLKDQDFRRVITDDRVVVNGLFAINAKFDDNQIRFTNLFIRDTLKQARLGIGTRSQGNANATFVQQDTAWFARQLFETQVVGEFKITPELSLDLRGSYAKTKRDAPDEFSYEYYRSNAASDPYGQIFINSLNNGQTGDAEATYSFLTENLRSGGADLSYKVNPDINLSTGYSYSDTKRRTERRDFTFTASGPLPRGLSVLRPDILLSQPVIIAGPLLTATPYTITLIDQNEANPVFLAKLRNHAGYARLQWQIIPNIALDAGVRYEWATQTVTPVQVFTTPTASLAGTNLQRSYWLPAATLTINLADRQQLRLNASKTIARPQFRELIFQSYFDPDSNRLFRGNPRLVDSQLYNFEARYEWYFASEQRLTVSGFFKRIDKPIETFASFDGNDVISSFANAPRANLYGGEIELVKYFDLDALGWDLLSTTRLMLNANYTYTKSQIKVKPTDTVAVFNSSSTLATDFFRDGVPLTGQSNHLVNLEIGLEDRDHLSQQTFLLSYSSDRVTNRGASLQPDIKERPGLRLDFVMREGVKIAGAQTEVKLEVRNITGTKYQEFQQSGANRIYYNRYDVGTTISLSVGLTF